MSLNIDLRLYKYNNINCFRNYISVYIGQYVYRLQNVVLYPYPKGYKQYQKFLKGRPPPLYRYGQKPEVLEAE